VKYPEYPPHEVFAAGLTISAPAVDLVPFPHVVREGDPREFRARFVPVRTDVFGQFRVRVERKGDPACLKEDDALFGRPSSRQP